MIEPLSFEIYPRIAKHAALNDAPSLTAALRSLGGVSSDLSAIIRYHHLAATILATLDAAGARDHVDARVIRAIESAYPRLPTAENLLQGFEEMRQALAAQGIASALLKGVYFAERFYGGYHRRPQFDLDILIRARHRRAARAIFDTLGYQRQMYDSHSETYRRDVMKADVHGWLRRAPAYRIDEDAVWKGVHPERVGAFDVPTLSDEFNLVLLGLSCFEDVGQGMIRLKSLVDLFLFLRQVDANTDWDSFWIRRERERTDRVLATIFAFALALFEGEGQAPQLETKLSAQPHRGGITRRDQALTLVSAPRKHPANLAWFGDVYPGSLTLYLAAFWLGGFPDNLKEIRSGRLWSTLRVAFKS